jgi:A/G-specific adenine glycosylase
VTNSTFTRKLLQWHGSNKRPLPWKKTSNPYRIWLSEIILQQTRVEQGTPYYLKMIRLFPTVKDLAKAHEDQVLSAWQGLGYYSRAKNLQAAAKQIVANWNGKFPDRYEEILQLKGVGEYTAAAIASFAFGLPHAVVDGNVYRVLARVFGITENIHSAKAKKTFFRLANELLDRRNPGAFNQAIMDFGSLVCRPANPLCNNCCFRRECRAFQQQKIQEWPVNRKNIRIRKRWLNFMIIETADSLIIRKRREEDIWPGLFEWPVLETQKKPAQKELLANLPLIKFAGPKPLKLTHRSEVVKHLLSHQTLFATFFHFKSATKKLKLPRGAQWVKKRNLLDFPLPKLLENYWKNQLH